MANNKNAALLTGMDDRSYISLKTSDNKRFFVVAEGGNFYRVENRSLMMTQLSYLLFLRICIRIAEGSYKVVGTGQYSQSIFENNVKKEVI